MTPCTPLTKPLWYGFSSSLDLSHNERTTLLAPSGAKRKTFPSGNWKMEPERNHLANQQYCNLTKYVRTKYDPIPMY